MPKGKSSNDSPRRCNCIKGPLTAKEGKTRLSHRCLLAFRRAQDKLSRPKKGRSLVDHLQQRADSLGKGLTKGKREVPSKEASAAAQKSRDK